MELRFHIPSDQTAESDPVNVRTSVYLAPYVFQRTWKIWNGRKPLLWMISHLMGVMKSQSCFHKNTLGLDLFKQGLSVCRNFTKTFCPRQTSFRPRVMPLPRSPKFSVSPPGNQNTSEKIVGGEYTWCSFEKLYEGLVLFWCVDSTVFRLLSLVFPLSFQRSLWHQNLSDISATARKIVRLQDPVHHDSASFLAAPQRWSTNVLHGEFNCRSSLTLKGEKSGKVKMRLLPFSCVCNLCNFRQISFLLPGELRPTNQARPDKIPFPYSFVQQRRWDHFGTGC